MKYFFETYGCQMNIAESASIEQLLIARGWQKSEDAETAVYNWLKTVGVPSKLRDEGFSESDIPNLVNLAFTTPSLDGLLAIAPTDATKEAVAQIYTNSL